MSLITVCESKNSRNILSLQGMEETYLVGSQFIMARRHALYINLWYQSYETDYKPDWAYNALRVPYMITQTLPEVIHVHGYSFTNPPWGNRDNIFKNNFNWSQNYGLHFFSRWYKELYDEQTMRRMNSTLGSIARYILYGNKELCL